MTFEEWISSNRAAVMEFDRLEKKGSRYSRGEAAQSQPLSRIEAPGESHSRDGRMFELLRRGEVEVITGATEAMAYQAETAPALVDRLQRHFFNWRSELRQLAAGLSSQELGATFLPSIQAPILQLLSGHEAVPQATLLDVIYCEFDGDYRPHSTSDDLMPLIAFRHWVMDALDTKTAWQGFLEHTGADGDFPDYLWTSLSDWYYREAQLPLHSAAIREYLLTRLPELVLPELRYEVEQSHRHALFAIYADVGHAYAEEHYQWLERNEEFAALKSKLPEAVAVIEGEPIDAFPDRLSVTVREAIGGVWGRLHPEAQSDLFRGEICFRSEYAPSRLDAAFLLWRAIERAWQKEFAREYPAFSDQDHVVRALSDAITGQHRDDPMGVIGSFVSSRPDPKYLRDKQRVLPLLRRLKDLRSVVVHGNATADALEGEIRKLHQLLVDDGFLRTYFAALLGET